MQKQQKQQRQIPGLESPGARQAQATNPLKSHWVGASAGTGKTKVLIDRVLRLMLPRPGLPPESATPPGKILCLTFTKTAAAEMSNRIYMRLGEWAVMEDAELDLKLEDLTGVPATTEVRAAARRLFARVLDTPGGLKIMTIHSFCQSVLKRFPVEAGLAPHFELMDEQGAVEYLTKCLHDIIAEAKEAPGSAIAASFSALALHLDSAAMSDLMSKIMANRSLLSEILKTHGDAEGQAEKTIDAVYDALGVGRGETEEDLLAAACDIVPEHEAGLREVLAALQKGGKRDGDKAELIAAWLERKNSRPALLPLYRGAFLTKEGEILKNLASKAAIEACPHVTEIMTYEAERLREVESKLQALRLAAINAALLTVASEMVGHYARYKRHADKLDFDDLIIRTCALLSAEGAVQWVLYKLDEGIDHILVDEAQDTSPYQWRVVQALSSEFFAGEGTRGEAARTLFVVGDEKQSIFSFQGADPEAFARMQDFFGGKAKDVQEGWDIQLEYSFRSVRTVLELVDSVFAREEARKGVAARAVRHLPFRAGHAGLVELWPLAEAEAQAAEEAWKVPVRVEGGDTAPAKLARKVAATIRGWLDSGETLASRGRPLRAGDILILVQSRGAFVELLMRALKEKEVPVAGIDRMRLTEEIAVMDLLAAAQFALLPRDDLTLAAVLKSPLVGISETELYQLCRGRSGTLWSEVRAQRQDIADFLSPWVARAGRATPYEFFAGLLDTPCFADGVSGRRALYGRLGFDIQDALDEFLNGCLHYEQTHVPALQKFVDWFLRGETEVKREQEHRGQDQVRIMTVHGAKGLQAPVVFLPDTARKMHDHPRGRVRLIWPEDESGVPLWSPRAEFDAPFYANLRDAARQKQEEEYRRLLYVALTRAEDRLYICGWKGKKREPKDDCWYNLVASAFPASAQDIADEEGGVIRRFTHAQEKPPALDGQGQEKAEAARYSLPPWALLPPPPEPAPFAPLAPSRPGDEEPAARGPLDEDEAWRFRRGNIVHRILEVLPQLDPDVWEKTLSAWLARPALQIPEPEQKNFAAEILAVLRHPDFAPIFGPGSRAEVPVMGLVDKDLIVSGQMDRVLVRDNQVFIIDYKTNRPPPREPKDVPVIYLKQMAAYLSVMRRIYPQHTVKTALLWTDGPFLMPLPQKLLEPYIV